VVQLLEFLLVFNEFMQCALAVEAVAVHLQLMLVVAVLVDFLLVGPLCQELAQ
jgi:hypothetical protein